MNMMDMFENAGIHRFVMPAIESNMYMLVEGSSAMVIDPNANGKILTFLQENHVQSVTVLLTHEHYDHICGVNTLRERYKTHVLCSKNCALNIRNPNANMAKFWDVLLMDKSIEIQNLRNQYACPDYVTFADESYAGESTVHWRNHKIKLYEAPGHSVGGSLIIMDGNLLFSGDNLVNGKAAICRFPGGNKTDYLTITKPMLDQLDNSMLVFPGHGEPAELGCIRQYAVPFVARRKNT